MRTAAPHPDRWRILTVSLVVGFMSLLDVTIVNVAIPSIRAGLDTSVVHGAVGGVGLHAHLRAHARGRRPARRRLRPPTADARRARPVRGHQRRGGPRAHGRAGGGGAAAAGSRRRAADAAELRAHPAAVHRRRAGPGVRAVRDDGVGGLRGGAVDRRRAHRAGRRRTSAGGWCSWSTCRSGSVAMVAVARLVPRRAAAASEPAERIDVAGAVAAGPGRALPAVPDRQPGGRCAVAARAARRRARVRLGVRALGAPADPPRPCAAARPGAAAAHARVRQRDGGRGALLHRVHRGVPGAVGLAAGRPRPRRAARRAAADAVRGGLGGRPRRWPAGWCRGSAAGSRPRRCS